MISFPFDSLPTGKDPETGFPTLDRAQYAYQLQDFGAKMFSSGILPNIKNCFKVTPGNGMQVFVAPGVCWVWGAMGIESEQRTLVIQSAEKNLDRIDTVVIRKDNNRNFRNVDIYVKRGIPNQSPVPPTLTRETNYNNASGVYEIAVANIYVARGTTTIPEHRIQDTRLDGNVCGVSAPYATVDTTGLYNQWQSAFDAWFSNVKGQLSTDAAGNLQNQINDVSDSVKKIKQEAVSTDKELEAVAEKGKLLDALLAKNRFAKFSEKLKFPGKTEVGTWFSEKIYCTLLSHSYALNVSQKIPNNTHLKPLFYVAFMKNKTNTTVYMLPWENSVYIEAMDENFIWYKNNGGSDWSNYDLHILVFHF